MIFKKAGGKIFGLSLTEKEWKFLNAELKKDMVKESEKFDEMYLNVMLWVMYKKYGFRKRRLKKFMVNVVEEIEIMKKDYMSDKCDCTAKHLLATVGIRLEEL